MSLKALSDYTIYAKYARYSPTKKRRETWNEQVDRVFQMHEKKFSKQLENSESFRKDFEFAKQQVLKKRVLGSQRSLQFGGEQIEKHAAKMYNCSYSYCDRLSFFGECMYLLLCGVGVGVSVQKQHVAKLPNLICKTSISETKTKFVVEDSIEGWSDAIQSIISSFHIGNELTGANFEFDYSKVRPEGSLISGGFKAPGSKGLSRSIEKIREILLRRIGNSGFRLRPIDAFDIVMHSADAVLSGGVRRSAVITLFSIDDDEMMNSKIGDWFIKNPQRGRSNNSAVLLKGSVTKEQFSKLMKSTKEFGEPGFVWVDDLDIGYNPCVEIGLYPKTEDGRSGFQFCNLSSINGKWCKTEEDFYQACRAAAIIGTLQAAYTDFKYVSKETKEITEREALLGCSITGMMDNPEIIYNVDVQRKGAEEIRKKNKEMADILGIRQAARLTAIKPEGTASCVLGTASGTHPHHAKRYIRRVQANKMEFPVQYYQKMNPLAVEESVWSNNKTDMVVSFLCEVPAGAITKNQLSAIELLEKVKLTQQNWVEYGTNIDLCVNPKTRHNVSNTITVKTEEWDEVEKYIFDNQQWFAGISLLPFSGDKDYAQAPFTTIHEPKELVKMYGDASMFASGLIVDGLSAFNKNLWKACDTVLGFGEDLSVEPKIPEYPKKRNNGELAQYFMDKELYDAWFSKTDWIRRVKKFADNYFNGDVRQATYCLKDVSNWKLWVDLSREHKHVDWSEVVEDNPYYQNVDTLAGAACAGGKCELNF